MGYLETTGFCLYIIPIIHNDIQLLMLTKNKRTNPINGNIQEIILLDASLPANVTKFGIFDMNDSSKIFGHYFML